MPPVLRKSNSLRSREHRRVTSTLSFKLLGLTIVCISLLLTVYELSSDGDLVVEDGRERHLPHRLKPNAKERSSVLHSHRHRTRSIEKEEPPLLESSGPGIDTAQTVHSKRTQHGDTWNPAFEIEDKSVLGEDKSTREGKEHDTLGNSQLDEEDKKGQELSDANSEASEFEEEDDPPSQNSETLTFVQRLLRSWAPWFLSRGSTTSLPIHVTTDAAENEAHCETASNSKMPRVIPKCWKPPKQCGTAEDMGSVAVGSTEAASLRVRELINIWMANHGAAAVRELSGEDFCERKFVLGLASEDGFGNNMYKVLTAAGLSLMLNRSLIIGELGSKTPSYIGDPKNLVRPFGEYLIYSNQTFSMQEVKQLWALHDCVGKNKRLFTMRVDDIEHGPAQTKSLCDDWTTLPDTVLWFKGTLDTVALQLLLKNENTAMRLVAATVLGNPSVPSSRPNTFGELLQAFVRPSPDIEAAVEWALQGGPAPDFSLHLRLRHNRSHEAPAASAACILRIIQENQQIVRRKQRMVVISDTPEVFSIVSRQLGDTVEIIRFDYMAYLNEFKNLSEVMSLQYGQPPRNKMRDWGEMPRWVSLVDFYLAARAKVAVISGANERVCTTYAQLIGSLAAASTLTEHQEEAPCAFYSSFQRDLVAQGLVKQSGWGHAWRTFGGKLGCRNQAPQCARTPLLPYAWWDAPWQSPTTRDVRKMQNIGIQVDDTGQILESSMDVFCKAHRNLPPTVYKMKLPA